MRVRIKFHPRESDEICEQYKRYSTNEKIIEIASNYKYVIGMNTMALLQIGLCGGATIISYEPKLVGKEFSICNKDDPLIVILSCGKVSYISFTSRLQLG